MPAALTFGVGKDRLPQSLPGCHLEPGCHALGFFLLQIFVVNKNFIIPSFSLSCCLCVCVNGRRFASVWFQWSSFWMGGVGHTVLRSGIMI